MSTRGGSLARFLPASDDDDAILSGFLAWVEASGLTLYPAQEQALLEIVAGKNVILATPTGSGKSILAYATCFFARAKGRRCFYTSPIKALANEKFLTLIDEFGADDVGMMTGDAAVNRDAPIVCCTAEILANMALREGIDAAVDDVVMDEFHYYSDPERGVAWQIPLLVLSRCRFLLMSATLGDTTFFEKALSDLTGLETALVSSAERPVPLDFSYREIPLHETVAKLVSEGRAPIYIVSFTQRAAAEEAQNLMSVDFCTKLEKRAIVEALVGARFDSPYGPEISRFVRHGIGLHHAGLLPKYRLIVERLAQAGHLKVISGTDTLGVGVNIPIRTVLFTKLCKFDGSGTKVLSVRDFQQISGRAGRKGFDDRGSVVAQAPEHVIENIRLEAKVQKGNAKRSKIVKRKPPERGYAHWDRATFDKLSTSQPEPLVSKFQVSHGMIVNVLSRPDGGCMDLARLIHRSHDRVHDKRANGRTALQMFRSLLDAGVVEIASTERGRRATVSADLQQDFSLNQALSLYLLDTLGLLDPESETHSLDVLTLVESILENPEVVLMRQLDKLKTEAIAEMKAQGIEYDERMQKLEEMEYPKPNRDFVYDTFNAFAAKHPWVGSENIRPKSIARDMVEQFLSFSEYVREYGLERSEGLLLRYLSEVYKVLARTLPVAERSEEIDELLTFFGAMVRQVDSSLLDEWERIRSGEARPAPAAASVELEPEGSKDVTRDRRGFVVLVRNELFRLVRTLAGRDWNEAQTLTGAERGGMDARAIEAAVQPFFETHARLRVDPDARSPKLLTLEEGELRWEFAQVLLDPEGDDDWVIVGSVDIEASRELARPVLVVTRIGS
jgi:superfamily II RNA helicase